MKHVVDLCLAKHPLWSSLVDNPPEDVKYRILSSGLYSRAHFEIANYFPFLVNPTHFCNGAKPLRAKPWVVDFESAKVFFKKYEDLNDSGMIDKALTRLEPCRKLLPTSQASKRTIIKYLGIQNKRLEVLYPAIKLMRETPRYNNGSVNILFVGKYFEYKGGREVLKAFAKLGKNDNIHLTVVGNVDQRYKEWVKGLNVTFYDYLPRERIFDLYYVTDIFIMPSSMDTFGCVLLEAMSFGIPVIASNNFAAPEFVKGAGLLVNMNETVWNKDGTNNFDYWNNIKTTECSEDVIGSIMNFLHILIEDPDLRFKLGTFGISAIRNGIVSIPARNKQLSGIYSKAFDWRN